MVNVTVVTRLIEHGSRHCRFIIIPSAHTHRLRSKTVYCIYKDTVLDTLGFYFFQ